ncbi:hypothetical protein LCGC14_0652150 [marine sediment metagenome]|uniref:Uncharacterized protein n=1 Tax=marine sediment metagenome TaxID=412755 RepID=A0A0F9RFW0_9ZZZZ
MNNVLIGVLVVGGFILWKFILQPIMNANEPIEPPDDYKTFGEKLEDSINVDTDIDF